MRLTPGQLEKYHDVLEKLLAELLQDTPDGTARGLISALGILPSPPLIGSSAHRLGDICRPQKGFCAMFAHFTDSSDTPLALV